MKKETEFEEFNEDYKVPWWYYLLLAIMWIPMRIQMAIFDWQDRKDRKQRMEDLRAMRREMRKR